MEFISTILSITRETNDTVTLRIEAKDFNFKAGQFVMLTLNINGEDVKRAYSISSSPSEKGYIEITSKKAGLFSGYLDEKVKVGDSIKVNGPHGLFVYEDAESYVFIAAGSGIAPMRGLIRKCIENKKDMQMIFSVKTSKDIIYENEIKQWDKIKNFKSMVILTQQGGKRVDLDFLKNNIKFDEKTLFYICGPPKMVTDTTTLLEQLNVKKEKIKTERFG